jgi:hypothetical protein
MAPKPPPAPTPTPQQESDAELDIAEEDSFPASDPPSMTDPAKNIRKPEESGKS